MQSNSDTSPVSARVGIETLDYELSVPAWGLENLKICATYQQLARPRSLAWAILLNAVPPPDGDIVKCMKTHRNFYNDLRSKLSMDPRAVLGDDPLSQNDESAWKQHFCDNELKALILQDVVRTFPDEVYYRDKDVQDMMVRVLFFWARSHAHVGYRQGMHEVLAPLLFELYTDRKYAPQRLRDETLKYYLDFAFIEHDSYMLFSSVMRGLEKFYTTGDAVPSSCGRLPVSRSIHNPNEVVRYLERVKEKYLVPLDKELATHLDNCNITMELFGIRWLRLLFGREFPRAELPGLWGFLFSDGPTLPNVHYVIVAMLLSMRSTLLGGDAGSALSCLMRGACASAGHVAALALHLRSPRRHARPPPPPPRPPPPLPAPVSATAPAPHDRSTSSSSSSSWTLEQTGSEGAPDCGSEGVAEGADVARELAALALVRARLPPAAAALLRALPHPPAEAIQPLQQIMQLSALLQCRNHALIDVETALEAAEGQNTDKIGRRQLVPVTVIGGHGRRHAGQNQKPVNKTQINNNKVKEVPLKVFHQAQGVNTGKLPCTDPLRLRTE